jgi:hypothetical protein
MSSMVIQREWAMPSADTFTIPPIAEIVKRYLAGVSVDPFARNNNWATYTNDLNPQTSAQYHMDAVDFINMLASRGVKADVILFDPPYSSRQVKEVYAGIGRKFCKEDNQNSIRWTKERGALLKLCKPGTIVLSFGWNSTGIGNKRGFEKVEILIVNHGSAHNDTICVVERKQ